MRDGVRVSVESNADAESARVHDDSGAVSTGEATFRFSLDGTDPDDASGAERSDGKGGAHEDAVDEGDGRDPCFVAPVAEIPVESTLRCEAFDGCRGTEIIVRRESENDVFAWRNSCPHKPYVQLDPGGGAIVDDDQIVCHEHGARFECGDGFCTAGPCRGDALDEIDLEVRDGDVYLADDRFDACNRLP